MLNESNEANVNPTTIPSSYPSGSVSNIQCASSFKYLIDPSTLATTPGHPMLDITVVCYTPYTNRVWSHSPADCVSTVSLPLAASGEDDCYFENLHLFIKLRIKRILIVEDRILDTPNKLLQRSQNRQNKYWIHF